MPWNKSVVLQFIQKILRFVLKKSLDLGLKPIVVINKIDKPAAMPLEAQEMVYELFLDLGASDAQLNFTSVYTIARQGLAKINLEDASSDLTPLLDIILEKVPIASSDEANNKPLRVQPFNLGYDNFLGRLAVGRIYEGKINKTQNVFIKNSEGKIRTGKISKLFTFEGLNRKEVETVEAGDIVMIAGLPDIYIGETICEDINQEMLPAINIDEPTINVPEEMSGIVIEKLSKRHGNMLEMKPEHANLKIVFEIPTRGLLGYRNEFVVDTRGEGIIYTRVIGFKPFVGHIQKYEVGSMVSMATGKALGFSLFNLQDRGTLYIGATTEVYEGMVIGNVAKGNDLNVNPTKGKQLTNMRASGADEAIRLTPPTKLTLEKGMGIMNEDEYLEITPKNIRLRKQKLKETDRIKDVRAKKK